MVANATANVDPPRQRKARNAAAVPRRLVGQYAQRYSAA